MKRKATGKVVKSSKKVTSKKPVVIHEKVEAAFEHIEVKQAAVDPGCDDIVDCDIETPENRKAWREALEKGL